MQLIRTLAAAAAVAIASASSSAAAQHPETRLHPSRLTRAFGRRDASTVMSGGDNNEGEAHGTVKAPSGSYFTSLPVGSGGETVAAFWSDAPQNKSAPQAFIMIHGKLRNGDEYWTTMNDILVKAVQDNVPGASNDSIVVAPEFFSTKYNSGQYDSEMLAFGDVNAWQAGDVATHPTGTKLTSFDAIDSLVDEFQDSSKYPNMKNITVVGHGGGGQLIQRYAAVAKAPAGKVPVRYIHGDASSCAYFTEDRPISAEGVQMPSKSNCDWYNYWRYGFYNFTGTADGLKTPQQYFQQYITRDVVSIVGYEDTSANGDQYCMAQMQGGVKRRDRNLAWWQYVNTLARTNEDIDGFPATFGPLPDWSNISSNVINTRLVVIQNATHSADEVFSATDGQAVLFSDGALPVGWRPAGWKPAAPVNRAKSNASSTASGKSAKSTSAQHDTSATSGAAMNFVAALSSLLVTSCAALFLL